MGEPGQWHVLHDDQAPNTYETKEAAFEAAVMAASLALRQGHEVIVSAPGGDGTEATTGARSSG
jgi:phosphotransferase system HPr-like phosphotransfer protein